MPGVAKYDIYKPYPKNWGGFLTETFTNPSSHRQQETSLQLQAKFNMGEKKLRRCLKCLVKFVSRGKTNRCCGSCAAQNERAADRCESI